MDSRTILRQLLRAPPAHRAFLQTPTRPQPLSRTYTHASHHQQTRLLSVPTIFRPQFWTSLIPRAFRPGSSSTQSISESTQSIPTSQINPQTGRREWNPATPYIILAILVGSQAIQILWLKRERLHFTRRSEAKIGVLREVIERVQKGEEVGDLGAVLGSGDEGREAEWEEVMKEIESEELLWRSKKRRRAARESAEAAEAAEAQEKAGDVKMVVGVQGKGVRSGHEMVVGENVKSDGKGKAELYKGARFY